MTSVEIIAILVTFIGVTSISAVFTLLYHSYISSIVKEIQTGKRDIELIDETINDKKEKVKKRRKIMSIIKSICFYGILIIIIPIFIFSIINKFTGGTAMIGGKSIMVVASGSMSEKNKENNYLVENNLNNQFATYDIIVLKEVTDPTSIKLYDVIAFKNDKNENIIHRIIAINDNNGEVTYTTRGDANNASDTYHPKYEDIIGRYSNSKIKGIGIFVIFFQSYPGIITILSMIYILIMIDILSNKLRKEQDSRVNKLASVIEQIDENGPKPINVSYKETIYYKGYAYQFDENGFIAKDEVLDEEILKKIDKTIIKVKENEDQSQTVDEIVMDEDSKEGEE